MAVSIDHFGSDVWRVAVKFHTEVHGPQMMNPTDLRDTVTCDLGGQVARLSQGRHVETDNHRCSHSHLSLRNWGTVGSPSTRREPSDEEPSCCEAKALTAAPLCRLWANTRKNNTPISHSCLSCQINLNISILACRWSHIQFCLHVFQVWKHTSKYWFDDLHFKIYLQVQVQTI